MSDWLDELHQLHEEDKVKQKDGLVSLNLSVLSSQRNQEAASLLNRCDAHKLLRRAQKVLLAGKGTIDIFEQKSSYERIITLAWQGPISNARVPDPADPEDCKYIFIGVKQGKIYVNGQELLPVTPEALKLALVQAAKSPRVQSNDTGKVNAVSKRA